MNIFRCYIIGEDNLHIQCANIIKEKGHVILGIISNYEHVKNWALQNEIPYFPSLVIAKKALLETKFDYLFSIVNSQILPLTLINKAKYFAINFHDALLPKYAGVHATSWAILNEEKVQGVTWHVMDELVDAGDILKQASIPIESDETAFSLNLKCYETALALFPELIDELANESYQRIPQDLKQRTYLSFNQKPINNGWINWSSSAQEIETLYRALQLGNYINRLSSIKFKIKDQFFIITQIAVLSEKSNTKPGTFIAYTHHHWRIATGTEDILILAISTIDGHVCHLDQLREFYALQLGVCLQSAEEEDGNLFKQVSQALFKQETYWVNKWQSFQASPIPFLSSGNGFFCKKDYEPIKQLQILDRLQESNIEKINSQFSVADILLTMVLVYLYRVSGLKPVNFLIETSNESKVPILLRGLINQELPSQVNFEATMTFSQAITHVIETLSELTTHNTFLSDIYFRYPRLSELKQMAMIAIVVVDPANSTQEYHSESRASLIVEINPKQGSIHWYIDRSSLQKEPFLQPILQQMPGHLGTLLNGVMKTPQILIKDLPLLTNQEYQRMIIDWNSTMTEYPRHKTVHQLFEEQAAKNSSCIAASFGDKSLTYKQLNQRSNQLAYYLQARSIKKEDAVAICMDHGIELIVGILGILKAGAAYVPIDPSYPFARIEAILKDSQSCLIILSEKNNKLEEQLRANYQIVNLKSERLTIKKQLTSNLLLSDLGSENLAYIMYTSGSTGQPKGIEILHRGITRLVINTNYIDFKSTDVIAHISNPSFDASTFEIWGALLNGAKLVILKKSSVLDPMIFIEELTKHAVSIMWLTAAFFNQLVQAGVEFQPSLRRLLIGGEALNVASVKKFLQVNKNAVQLMNGYGPTENTTFSLCFSIEKVSPYQHSIPIGKPISNSQAYVLDSNNKPVPVGYIGELYLGGDGLARNYRNKPQLTQSVFIQNPLDETKGKLYKTGDLARWLPTGDLDFIERIDSQVKIRGFRVDVREVEDSLMEYPAVLSAKVTLKSMKKNESKKLIAFLMFKKITNQSSNEITAVQLKEFLKNRLPLYMVPSTFYQVPEIPLNPNGKIDISQLIKLGKKISLGNRPSPLSARNDRENALCKLFNEMFHSEAGVTDNFFHLGGDSILAMQLVNKIHGLGLKCAVKDIFQYPTIESLAKKISKKTIKEIKVSHRKNLPSDFPLSPIQYWFFEKNFKYPNQFLNACILDIKNQIDVTLLTCCFSEIVNWFESLKLAFKKEGNTYEQFYQDYHSNISIDVIDIRDSVNWHELVIKISDDFDLSKGNLIKACLLRKQGKITKLLIVAHHLIIDGVSWRILLEDLHVLYQGTTFSNLLIQKFDGDISYQQWIDTLQAYVNSKIFYKESKYWYEKPQKKSIPIDYTKGPNLEKTGQVIAVELTELETDQLLNHISKLSSVKLNEILLAILVKVIVNWSQEDQVTIDIESHGREEISKDMCLTNTIGWFTSLFPANFELPSNSSLPDAISTIKQQLKKIPKNGIGYGLLRYFKKVELQPHSQIGFNYWGRFDLTLENSFFAFDQLDLISHPDNERLYLITVDSIIKRKRLIITWGYSKNYHKKETIQYLADEYIKDLKSLLKLGYVEYLTYHDKFNSIDNAALKIIDRNYGLSNVEDIYPLSPLQKGLLFHAIQSVDSGSYIVQLLWKSKNYELLNLDYLRQSIYLLIKKNQTLRTSYIWEKLEEPLQVILKLADFSWTIYDWSTTNLKETKSYLDSFLEADRQAGFRLDERSLFRVSIFKLPTLNYQFIFTLHHILIDGWSLPILFNDLSLIYSQLKKGMEFHSTTPTSHYHDYIKWIVKKNVVKNKKFWKNYLRDFESPTDINMLLPSLNTLSSSKLINIDTLEWFLSRSISGDLTEYATRSNVTLNILFQGVWGLLLRTYSQNDDVVFGITITTRDPNIPQIDHMVGLLINTLPLRIKFEAEQTVQKYLHDLSINFSEVISRYYTPITEIHNWSSIPNDQPLFDSLFVFEHYPYINDDATRLIKFNEIKIIDSTHYPLVCIIVPGESCKIKLVYDKDRIDHSLMEQLKNHFNTLVKIIVKEEQKLVYQCSLLGREEYYNLLTKFNPISKQDEMIYPLHQLIEQQTLEAPNNIAVSYEDQQLTYMELNSKANQLARLMQGFGVEQGKLVAICLERGVNMVAAILAVLKIGAAYLPIDPNYPLQRIEYFIDDSNTSYLLTSEKIVSIFKIEALRKIKIISIDKHSFEIHQKDKSNLPPTDANNLAYVIYTSGSTGNPKGVLITHENVVRLFESTKEIFQFNSNDKWSLFHSFSFDFSVWEIFGSLLFGGKLIIAPDYIQKDIAGFYKWLIKNKITVLNITPAVFYKLMGVDQVKKDELSLRYIIFGGESLSIKNLAPWVDLHGYQFPQLINMYGITETTIHTTYQVLDEKVFNKKYDSIIGKPIPGRFVYILDKYQMPVPVNITGEMYIGGNGVAKGYLNKPELTDKKFIINPFLKNRNMRLYRSGDLSKWLPDGTLVYQGRMDDQVKIRGFRIELGEIQEKIKILHGVKQAFVTVNVDLHKEPFLVAYIVKNKQIYLDSSLLRAHLSEQLPSYMRPTVFIFLEELPLTSNGKVDKNALISSSQEQYTQKNYKIPETIEEKIIASIWSDLLGIGSIGLDDNFFDLGGNSFSILKLSSVIEERFNITLALRDFISNPTIAKLAELISQSKNEKQALFAATTSNNLHHCLIPLQPNGTKPPLFLIHPIGGTVFWYISLVKYFDPDRPLYGIQDPGLEINPIPCSSVEELASYYLEVIATIQFSGPYYIGGASAGATISVEMARQLEAKGEKIAFIGLLDGWAPFPQSLNDQALFEANMRRQYHLMSKQFKAKGIQQAESLLELQWARSRMMANYKVPIVNNKLTLFKARDTVHVFKDIEDPYNHWMPYSFQPIDLYVSPGDHETMFDEPNVKELAQKINKALKLVSQTDGQIHE